MVRVGKYDMGRTLGEGNFGKVKHGRHEETGKEFAIKILDRRRVLNLGFTDQIKREIGTLKLLSHPNVVRLYEVLASKTKIYMVLEYVNGGELFDKVASRGRLPEHEGRRLFQQLIDAVSYCHDKGVFHRDLKPENVLIDVTGNIKVTDFGLSALPQNFGKDGLLHTTCGSPNYVAPEVLANKGYNGAASDIWSCGVILYVMLTGSLPFDDDNLAILYQKIMNGEVHIPNALSHGARDMLKRILDPNPGTRINFTGIKANDWFREDYSPTIPNDDGINIDDDTFLIKEVKPSRSDEDLNTTTAVNAFELIGMSSGLDLSGFFEEEDISERKLRFTSNYCPKALFEKIESIATKMGFQIQKGHGKIKVVKKCENSGSPRSLSVVAEVFELSPSLYVVEVRKSYGDSSLYRQLCRKLSDDLGNCEDQSFLNGCNTIQEPTAFEQKLRTAAA